MDRDRCLAGLSSRDLDLPPGLSRDCDRSLIETDESRRRSSKFISSDLVEAGDRVVAGVLFGTIGTKSAEGGGSGGLSSSSLLAGAVEGSDPLEDGGTGTSLG